MTDCIITFTGKGIDRIVREGGSGEWRLAYWRAKTIPYLVCTQNRTDPHDLGGTAPDHSAFLVGKISNVIPSPNHEGRYRVIISDYSELDVPNVWKGWRYPVHYSNLETVGINISTLQFKPMPKSGDLDLLISASDDGTTEEVDTVISQAKELIAAHFQVPVSAVGITINF